MSTGPALIWWRALKNWFDVIEELVSTEMNAVTKTGGYYDLLPDDLAKERLLCGRVSVNGRQSGAVRLW
jgi:hypothetical protein